MSLGRISVAFAIAASLTGEPALPELNEILDRMESTDRERSLSLDGYTCHRKYVLFNQRFNKRAEVVAHMTWTAPGLKDFKILSESGPAVLRKRILHRMIEGEQQAAAEFGGRTPISRANYTFALVGEDVLDSRPTYLLEVKPKRESPFLIKGRIWVDAGDFAVTKVEGVFAKNPSFWTRAVSTVQEYRKHGDFWLPVASHSRTDARLFGATDVTIDYYDYDVKCCAQAARRHHPPASSP
jgi:hypothetical protein